MQEFASTCRVFIPEKEGGVRGGVRVKGECSE